jgi:hypothetical protein
MSDKPIHAEVVRADQIRVGDRIVWCDVRVDVKTIERGDYYGNGERIQFNALCVDNLFVKPSATVARILPEPVEVRGFWRVHYERFAIINGEETWQRGITVARDTEEQARKSFEGRYPANRDHIRNPIIEHVRETILSREEVQP